MNSFLLLAALIGAMSSSLALPLCSNGIVFYSAMPCYYRAESLPRAQRLMYVQYMHPPQGHVGAANNGLTTFVAADAIGAGVGAFVKGSNQEQEEHQEHVYDAVEHQPKEAFHPNVQGAVSIAEAYPAGPVEEAVTDHIEDEPVINALPEIPDYEEVNTISSEFDADRKGKAPNNFDGIEQSDEITHAYELTEKSATVTQEPLAITTGPVSSSPVPVLAATYIPPSKKIRVELEAPSEESEEHPYEPISPKAARPPPQPTRAPARQPQQPLPAGTFFPINFGGASGGAIAIANSFSTGDGGSATSHATAYGSPSGRSVSRKRTV